MTKKEENKKDETFNDVYELLSYIQINLKVPKSNFNKFGNFHYRSLENIKEAIKIMLPKGASIIDTDSVEYIEGRFYIKSDVSLYYKEKFIATQGFAREEEGKKGMDASQVTGAASSYARKYAYNALFAIDDTRDADTMDNKKDNAPVSKTGNRVIDKAINEYVVQLQQCQNLDDLKGVYTQLYKQAQESGATDEQLGMMSDAKDARKEQLGANI